MKIEVNGFLRDDGRSVAVVAAVVIVSSNVCLEMIGARKGAVAQCAFEFTFARVQFRMAIQTATMLESFA